MERPTPSLSSALYERAAWMLRSPFHRVMWFLATTIGFVLSLVRALRCKPRGKDRFSVVNFEREARQLAQSPQGGDFADGFHRQAIPIIVDSFLHSEMREFVVALPFARTLEKKLRIERAFAALPHTRPLPRPIFIVGLPRTGSTLLHQLCGLDPRARAVRAWEFKMPVESSDAPRDKAERVRKVQGVLDVFYRLAPRIKAVHLVAATDPDECVQGYLDCVLPEMYCWGAVDADEAFDWFTRSDMTPMLRNYRRLLDVVLANDDAAAVAKQWSHLVLKSPHHTWKLQDLHRAFPEAHFVWIHRDPVSTVGSTCSMNEAILDATSARFVHPHVLGWRTAERLASCLEKGLRDRAAMPASRFVDVYYDDLKRDPLATLSAMYSALGLDGALSPEFQAAVQAHVSPAEMRSWQSHMYTLDHFGLDAEAIRRRFSFYYAAGHVNKHTSIGSNETRKNR